MKVRLNLCRGCPRFVIATDFISKDDKKIETLELLCTIDGTKHSMAWEWIEENDKRRFDFNKYFKIPEDCNFKLEYMMSHNQKRENGKTDIAQLGIENDN